MLFYPQKERVKERKLRYTIIIVCLLIHFLVFIISIVFDQLIKKTSTINLNLHSKACSVPVVFGNINLVKNRSIKADVSRPVIDNKLIKKVNNSQDKKRDIGSTTKKNSHLKPNGNLMAQKNNKKNNKRISRKKELIKSEKPKNAKNKAHQKVSAKNNAEETIKKVVEEKKHKTQKADVASDKIKKEHARAQVVQNNFEAESKLSNFVVTLENLNDMEICSEIQKNLIVPPGFMTDEPIKITARIDNHGKVQEVSERNSEPLTIYIALKKALIKSKYPKSKWGTKLEIIIQ